MSTNYLRYYFKMQGGAKRVTRQKKSFEIELKKRQKDKIFFTKKDCLFAVFLE